MWDRIEVQHTDIPIFQFKTTCVPLRYEDLEKKDRSPVTVIVDKNYKRAGGFNTVTDAWILSGDGSSGCRCLLRQSRKDTVYEKHELETILFLAGEGIHPPVYALNERYVVMEIYSFDLKEFLGKANNVKAFVALDKAYDVIHKLALRNILCTDIKPQNIVVKTSASGDVNDVRLIDMDGGYCQLLEKSDQAESTDYMANTFAMTYHLLLHLRRPEGEKLVNSIMSYAKIAETSFALKEAFEEALRQHDKVFEHYFGIKPTDNTFENAQMDLIDMLKGYSTPTFEIIPKPNPKLNMWGRDVSNIHRPPNSWPVIDLQPADDGEVYVFGKPDIDTQTDDRGVYVFGKPSSSGQHDESSTPYSRPSVDEIDS